MVSKLGIITECKTFERIRNKKCAFKKKSLEENRKNKAKCKDKTELSLFTIDHTPF